jgi:hypothetical protein
VFVRYSDIVMLGCAVVAVAAAAKLRGAGGRAGMMAGLGRGVRRRRGPVRRRGVRRAAHVRVPDGEITFSVGAVLPNLRYMPAHLIQAMPMLVPGLAALAWIAVRLRRADDERAGHARRDLAVGLALAASWLSV